MISVQQVWAEAGYEIVWTLSITELSDVWDHSCVLGICSTSWWDELTHTTKHWFTLNNNNTSQNTDSYHTLRTEHTHTHNTPHKHWFTHTTSHTDTHQLRFFGFSLRCFVGNKQIFKHSIVKALSAVVAILTPLALSSLSHKHSLSLLLISTHPNTHTHLLLRSAHTHSPSLPILLTHTFSSLQTPHTPSNSTLLSLSHTQQTLTTHSFSPYTHTPSYLTHDRALVISHHIHTHTFNSVNCVW